MNRMTRDEKKINKIYRRPKENLYSYRFFQDLSTGFSFTLAEKAFRKDFFSFEPRNCNVEKLLKSNFNYDTSYSIEQLIERAMYSLMVYGKAYIYIKAGYENLSNEQNKAEMRKLSSLEIEEIKGIIKKKTDASMLFISKGFGEKIFERNLVPKCLVILNIRDLGFREKYFTNLVRKLGKYDITSKITMLSEDKEGYDFSVHSKRNKRLELKTIKDVGWSFGTEGLSDSYILFKKMQMDILKIKALNYIVNEINKSLSCICGEDAGKIVAHVRHIDYDKVWSEYQNGEITVTELTNVLY